jgi:hypothetical protein
LIRQEHVVHRGRGRIRGDTVALDADQAALDLLHRDRVVDRRRIEHDRLGDLALFALEIEAIDEKSSVKPKNSFTVPERYVT